MGVGVCSNGGRGITGLIGTILGGAGGPPGPNPPPPDSLGVSVGGCVAGGNVGVAVGGLLLLGVAVGGSVGRTV